MVSLNNDIRLSNRLAEEVEKELNSTSFSKVFILMDKNTKEACLPIIIKTLPSDTIQIIIEPGERHKTIKTCEIIWQILTGENADRHALLINLGGGVICDMGGFCARTYKRGISFWNIPTTVLAQVDASVGGKLGVDFGEFKNHIGLFSEPDIVFIDPIFFSTLPKAEVVSGFAEMIKHSLIRDQEGFEELILEDLWALDWGKWISKSIEIKKKVVEEDPTEKGLRKILNFGHTIGHAIESHFLHTNAPLKHGEAIAIGIIAETFLSVEKCGLNSQELDKVIGLINREFPLVEISDESIQSISALAIQDKKNKDGIMYSVLLNAVGEPIIDIPISSKEIIDSLEFYNLQIK